MQPLGEGLLGIAQVQPPGRLRLVQPRQQPLFQQCFEGDGLRVAPLGGAGGLLQLLLATLQIGERQLGVNNRRVVGGVRLPRRPRRCLDDLLVLEAAHHMGDGVGLPDIGEELVAQPLALGGPGDEAGDVHEFHRGGNLPLGLDEGG